MGVYHFMGLGTSIGTVTKAVDYINKAIDLSKTDPILANFFSTSGGISHSDIKGAIEALVIFTSKEIIFPNIIPESDTKTKQNLGLIRANLAQKLKEVWTNYDVEIGRKIFWCPVNINNYNDCFEKILKAVYWFSPINKQGKEIWVNLTGGTNFISISLLNASWFTAKMLRLYQFSQTIESQNQNFVPSNFEINPNNDGLFNTVPFLKVDINFYDYLEILYEMDLYKKTHKKPIKNQELLSRLKHKETFSSIDLSVLIDNYLLRLYGLGFISVIKDKDSDEKIHRTQIESEITDLGIKAIEELTLLPDLIKSPNIEISNDWMEEENLD